MKIVLRAVAVLFVAIAAFLLYAVVSALTSSGGAKAGVTVGYVVGAIVLVLAAVWLWRRRPAECTARPFEFRPTCGPDARSRSCAQGIGLVEMLRPAVCFSRPLRRCGTRARHPVDLRALSAAGASAPIDQSVPHSHVPAMTSGASRD